MATRRSTVISATLVASAIVLAGAHAGPARAGLGPGCDPDRPAIAHHAGGAVIAQDPSLIPCGTETGWFTGETGIGVTQSGTVWFSAADWEWALVRTKDNGAHWQRVVVPGPQAWPGCMLATSSQTPACSDSESSKNNTVGDAFLLVDRDTSRLFWSKTYGEAFCSSMNYSDDGELWHPVTSYGCPGGDYGKMASGPPPAGGAQPTGYPNVLYECVNALIPFFVVGPARGCYKSLDGGATSNLAGVPPAPSPLAPGCLHFQEPQVVGRDGTIYMALACGSQGVKVAISHDEAQTWSYVTVPLGAAGSSAALIGGTGVNAAVDDAGNLYVVWPATDATKVYLAVSTDHGATWSAPLLVNAPGVSQGSPKEEIDAREPGHIAIAYYGYTSSSTRLSGYITESFDATSANPTFYSAPVNDPNDPLYYPFPSGSLPRNDYLRVTIGPDGIPWAAFVKLKGTTADSQGFVQSSGFAGRLVAVSQRPDLTVASVTQPSSVTEGDDVTLHAQVRNLGPGDAEDVVVRFLVDGTQVGDDRTLASLAASTTTSVTSSEGWVATAGSHTVTVRVDPDGVLAETNEANNSGLAPFSAAPSPVPIYGPGCDPSRPAIAHHAGGTVVSQAPARIPCGTETGQFTGETGIGVTPSGTVWFSAADWEWGLVRTHDLGRHWERFTVPGPQAYPGCGVLISWSAQCSDSEQSKYNTVGDAYVLVDRDTGRTFWSKTYGYAVCSSMNYSDDGELWHPVTNFGCPGGDYGKMASGPPPAGSPQPTGYPNVVYECVNGTAPTFVAGPARVCYRSLDGGKTWNAPTGPPPVPSAMAPGCLHFQDPQVVGRDGTLYMPLNCGNLGVMVAISHDQAQTWSYVTVPIGSSGNSAGLLAGVGCAVDDANNLYVVWPGSDNKVYLAVSTNQGLTWNGPLMVSAPGVTEASPRAQIDARAPGRIAIAYYGYTTSSTILNGYITESFDATATSPLFYSSTVNDPAKPLYFPATGTLPRNDYLRVAIGPDGTPWAAFVKLKSSTPDSQGYVQSTGFAGRTVPVAVPTAAVLRSFTAQRKGRAITLRWRTGTENGLLGFNLYRDGRKLNRTLIAAKGTTAGSAYRFVDTSNRLLLARYRLQAVRLDRSRVWLGSTRAPEGGSR